MTKTLRNSSMSPMQAIRANCLDCSGGMRKHVKWCPCDGVHSSYCPLWPFRFGMRPGTAAQRYGAKLLDPRQMPGDEVMIESLP